MHTCSTECTRGSTTGKLVTTPARPATCNYYHTSLTSVLEYPLPILTQHYLAYFMAKNWCTSNDMLPYLHCLLTHKPHGSRQQLLWMANIPKLHQHDEQRQYLDYERKMYLPFLISGCSSFCSSCSGPLNDPGRHRGLSSAGFHTLCTQGQHVS